MTNKELIDYCNSHWSKIHRCHECPYNHTYCKKFQESHDGDTPFMNEIRNDGEFYTDEEIKL